MLFEKEYRKAEEKIYKKGYIVENMTEPYNDLFEILDKSGKVVMEYLTLTQIGQLAEFLKTA